MGTLLWETRAFDKQLKANLRARGCLWKLTKRPGWAASLERIAEFRDFECSAEPGLSDQGQGPGWENLDPETWQEDVWVAVSEDFLESTKSP